MKILIFGSGDIGVAIGKVLEKKHKIFYWDKDKSKMPKLVDLADTIAQTDVVIIATPAAANREVAQTIVKYMSDDKPRLVLSVSKGLEPGSNKLMSDVLKEELPSSVTYGLLMGPMFAEDLMQGKPTTSVLSISDNNNKMVDDIFSGSIIKIEKSPDMKGVALCSVLKNLYTLGVGIAAGRGESKEKIDDMRQNSLNEMRRVVYKLGGDADTVNSSAGKDDFFETSSGPHSSNYSAGFDIGKNGSTKKTSEGLSSINGFWQLLNEDKQKYPILGKIKQDIQGKEFKVKPKIKLYKTWYFRILVAVFIIIATLLIIFWPRKTTTDSFTCPTETEYFDCMPKVVETDAERKAAERQAEYCQFIQNNCPGVSIVY